MENLDGMVWQGFEDYPLGRYPRIEWMQNGIYVVAMGVGGSVEVAPKDELTPPEFHSKFLSCEHESRPTTLRLMFHPAVAGIEYAATMDPNGQQPDMRAYLMIHGDYTLRYPTSDFGPIGNRRILKPGELWTDSYYYNTRPRVMYAVDFVGARLDEIRVSA